MKNKHIISAIKVFGSQADLARAMKVSPQMVTKLLNGKPVPPLRASQIEVLTGGKVTRKQLRPDDWRQLWPELR